MIRYLLFIVATALFTSSYAQNNALVKVVTHPRITIVTDPSPGVGVKCYTRWGVFPAKKEEIRSIKMNITLGSPDSLPTAHWDYLDHIRIKRVGGKGGKLYDYEIGRMLTPYGSIFTKGWNWTWSVDVTDFSLLMRDSVEIEYCHSGYETNTVGWTLTIDFDIVKGKEIIKPLSVTPMWVGNYKYGDPASDIEKTLAPIAFSTGKETGISRVRIQHTGHGMDTPKGCSEFCSRWREIVYNGKVIDHTDLWKNCGNNPLYPQGGTWIYDRAAWCPGDLQQPWIYDLVTSPGNHSVDIQMEPYTATENIQANESIASYLIQYSNPMAKCDVALESIIVPGDNKNFSRFNPAIKEPKIMIRNLGSDPLHTLDVTYGTKGFALKTYRWKGELKFYESDTITLPGAIDFNPGQNVFSATIKPVGSKDGWIKDNSLESKFHAPVVLPEKMVLQFLTNNKPEENRIVITNSENRVVFEKLPEKLVPRSMYYDTLLLPKGNYQFNLYDKQGDGLEFWYEPEAGFGYLRLLTVDGKLVKNFESDCGDGQQLSFSTVPDYKPDTTNPQYAFVLYPRRVKDLMTLDIHSDRQQPLEVVVTADGILVEKHNYISFKSGRLTFDFTYLPPKRYIIEVLSNGESLFKRRFNKE